jgi:hypothetical protein
MNTAMPSKGGVYMTKIKRETISIIYGSEYAIIKAKLNSDMNVLINVLRGISGSVAASVIATVMTAMTEIIREKCTVYDTETGTDLSIISVHVDATDIIISFTGFEIKSEKL